MKFAIGLLAFVALAAAKPQGGFVDWEGKCHDLIVKFEHYVNKIAEKNINEVYQFSTWFANKLDNVILYEQQKINETTDEALKAIAMFKDVDLPCYENATHDIVAAEQAAAINLASCKNLSAAYQDINVIAQNAQVVVADVLADAKVIVDGVAQCSPQTGLKKWECVLEYVAAEVKNLVEQWPDVKKFVAVVKVEGNDAQSQVEACLNDPKQVSLDKAIQDALHEFDACYKRSA